MRKSGTKIVIDFHVFFPGDSRSTVKREYPGGNLATPKWSAELA